MKILWGLLFALIVSSLSYAQDYNSKLYGLDEDIEELLKKYKAVGLSVAIVKGDKIIYAKGFGFRDFGKKLKMTSETAMPIGSSTKSFTASLLGILESEDRISLKDKPSFYIPRLQFYNDKMNNLITIEDLLSHKSGIGSVDGSAVFFPTKKRADFVPRFKYIRPNGEIKNSFLYSNIGYGLSGLVIENTTGKSYEANLREKIFKPLQMTNSFTGIDEMLQSDNYSLAYSNSNGHQKKIPYHEFSFTAPGGAIISSANDMGNWMITWINNGVFKEKQILPEEYVSEAITIKNILPQQGANNEDFLFGYGYGWFLQSFKGHYLVQHGGNTSGFSCQLALYPYEKIGIVVIANQHSSALPYFVEDVITNRMLGLPKKEVSEYPLQVSEMYEIPEAKTSINEERKPMHSNEEYCGEYLNEGYGTVSIRNEKQGLLLKFPNYEFMLHHQQDNVFQMEAITENSQYFDPRFQVSFLTNENGQIKTFQINLQEEPVVFKKQ